jgi:hypothetical protein
MSPSLWATSSFKNQHNEPPKEAQLANCFTEDYFTVHTSITTKLKWKLFTK